MSSDKKHYYELFNAKAEEFIKELSKSFPNIKHFATFKTGFNLLKNLDVKKPQNVFNTYVYTQYKDHIIKRNEDFFLNHDYDISSSKKEYWEEFIDQIGNIWKTLDNDNKDVVWKYFHVLVALNEKCVNNT